MNKRLLFTPLFLLVLLVACPSAVQAFPVNNYAKSSRLSTGKWVKISIPEDGIYQITHEELAQMGFNDPQSVRIYGFGGHPMSEVLNGENPDDLQPVPCKHFGDKLCFYGCGPVKYSFRDSTSTSPRQYAKHFVREVNSYSLQGYYFITSDDGTSPVEPNSISYDITGHNLRSISFDYWHHENEMISASQSGKDMLGEKITDHSIEIPYAIHAFCKDSTITVNPCVAVKSKNTSYVAALFNNKAVNFINSTRINSASSEYIFYNFSSPIGQVTPDNGTELPEQGNITLNITFSLPYNWARLDYCILSHYHHNTLTDASFNQIRMGLDKVSPKDIITINDANESTQLWNIDDPQQPKNYMLKHENGIYGFTPRYSANWTQFIAFDPTKELMSISGFEPVENQNLHALPVPDMVIVTCDNLLEQAQRIAQMHRDNDDMVVHVIDQQKIFNEFSSGTPSAMAIRLMNKMFYDRDEQSKFKYLLMFGTGSYDNRQILSKNDYSIITYESTISHDENNSYVSDDFFGMLDDNSGSNPPADLLRLGVGRIPCATLDEAESDVDKLLNYVNNPDYGPWRNNALYVADYRLDGSENDLHAVQAEGISNIINDELNILLNKNKVYVSQFPVDPATGFLLEGRKNMNSLLESGQFFMTYVGHANPSCLTHDVKLWTTNDSKKASYPHLPIITTACCDVARYDGSQRGLMEIMFHKPDGGAIAMLASTRSAYASGNDALNQSFVRAMFSYKNNGGQMPTLGYAYMQSKQWFGNVTSYNKMMFSLLGDPAMKINYPKPLFKITKVNGKQVDTANIPSGAMQKVTVEATVYKSEGPQVDLSFNGDATLSIYDYLKKELTEGNVDVYFPRKLLTQVSGRVVNGHFTATAVIPRYTQNPGHTGQISVYAHRDDSDEMVNGVFDKLMLNFYNANNSLTMHDSIPPTIDAIYFNDEHDFESCSHVPPTSMLHIRATDDVAFCNQDLAIGNSMDLKIDNGKIAVTEVKSYAEITNEGKSVNVDMPITLEPGEHSLTYTIYDIAGNMTSREIRFSVGNSQQPQLTVLQEPAVKYATFDLKTDMHTTPMITVKVFNHLGQYMWYKTTNKFPFNWDLKTRSGTRLPAGVYTYYGTFNDGTNYGGTNIGTIVIADDGKVR